MRKAILGLFCMACLTGCTDVNGSIEALKDQGLSPVEVGGYGLLACSKGDFFSTKFTAKRENGRIVNGVVCRGLFKGRTIRFK